MFNEKLKKEQRLALLLVPDNCPGILLNTTDDKIVKTDNLLNLLFKIKVQLGFPCGSAGKESTCNVEDLGLILGLGRSPGEGKGYPLRYSGLENSMDCIVHGSSKSQTRLSNFHYAFKITYNFCIVGQYASDYKNSFQQLLVRFYYNLFLREITFHESIG